MTHSPSLPVLDFYTRDGCELCAETRLTLQHVLEQRVMRGDPIVRVREIDLASQPELSTRLGALLPVLALDGQELTLAMGNRTIERFLDRVLGRAA
jgi:hypothetical protein